MPSAPTATRRGALRVAGAAAAVGLAGCSSSCPDSDPPSPATTVTATDDPTGETLEAPGEWPTLRGDAANTGFRGGVDGPGVDATLRWRATVPARPARPSAPALAGASTYVVDGEGTLRALATADGEEFWATETVADADAVTVADGHAFVAGAAGVVAVTAQDGRVAWRDDAVSATASAVAARGAVYVPAEDELRAYDAESGDVRWTVPFDGPASRAAVSPGGRRAYAVGGDLKAVSTAGGDVEWSASVGSVEHFPVVDGGRVFVGGYDGLVARDAATGDRLWTFERGGGRAYEAPVVAGDALYSMEQPGEGPGALFALDAGADAAPSPRWCSWLGDGDAWAALGDAAYVTMPAHGDRPGGSEAVQAFDRETGDATLQLRADRAVLPPAFADGAAVFVTAGGAVCGVGGG